jgi:hypothetical protein
MEIQLKPRASLRSLARAFSALGRYSRPKLLSFLGIGLPPAVLKAGGRELCQWLHLHLACEVQTLERLPPLQCLEQRQAHPQAHLHGLGSRLVAREAHDHVQGTWRTSPTTSRYTVTLLFEGNT